MRVGFTAGEVLCSADLHERCACFGCMSLRKNCRSLPLPPLCLRLWRPNINHHLLGSSVVRSRLSGLAVHPRRVLHGPAAPDWRGEHE